MSEPTLKCPQCIKEGKQSIVYVGITRWTLVASTPFYDKDGHYHVHDPNVTTQEYSCSNGHDWKVTEGPMTCPMGDFP